MANFVLFIRDPEDDLGYMDVSADTQEEAKAQAIKCFNGLPYRIESVFRGSMEELERLDDDDPVFPSEIL